MLPDLMNLLKSVVGTNHVLSGETAAPYCTDWRGRYSGKALAVVLPGDTQQVAAVVALCAEHSIAIVPQGGNTSLSGGPVATEGIRPCTELNPCEFDKK